MLCAAGYSEQMKNTQCKLFFETGADGASGVPAEETAGRCCAAADCEGVNQRCHIHDFNHV